MRSVLGLSALAATGVRAIMIPPGGDVDANGAFRIAVPSASKPLETFGVDPYTQIVKVPCPGCAFAEFNEKGVSWTKEQENYLVLNVSVGANPQTLEMNGVQIYPPALSFSAAEPEVLQVPADIPLDAVRSHSRIASPAHSLRVTAWSFQAGSVHTSGDTGEEVLNMHLRIHALEQRPVHIPEVLVTAVKNRKSELLLLKTEASEKPYSPPNPQKDCDSFPLLCKWRAIVGSKLEAMRHKFKSGCHKRPSMMVHHGKKPHHAKPHHRPLEASEEPHHSKPHHSKPHHSKPHHNKPHHHHHHKAHRVMHKIARVLLTIVIPLLVGILAGMLTYLIGMVVGTGIALVWIKIRGRRQQYAPIALEESDAEEGRESFEKGEFVEEEYIEAPPLYVEVEGKEIGQK